MSTVHQVIDPRFQALILPHAELECLYEGGRWLEGPLWLADSKQLLFSDIPNNEVLRWVPGLGVGVFSRGGYQNGRARGLAGQLIACEHGSRSLVELQCDGTLRTLASHVAGRRLNSPNDVAIHPDGSIWFTDPDYGILSDYEGHLAESEQPGCFVYRLSATGGEAQAVVRSMVKPNGLAFSPDANTLYVAESGRSHVPGTPAEIRRFTLHGEALVDEGRLCELACGVPDGMAVDELGHIWTSAGDGVHCFDSQGILLGKLHLDCTASNLCFGGAKNNLLFITTARRLFCLAMAVCGAPMRASVSSLASANAQLPTGLF